MQLNVAHHAKQSVVNHTLNLEWKVLVQVIIGLSEVLDYRESLNALLKPLDICLVYLDQAMDTRKVICLVLYERPRRLIIDLDLREIVGEIFYLQGEACLRRSDLFHYLILRVLHKSLQVFYF